MSMVMNCLVGMALYDALLCSWHTFYQLCPELMMY